LSLITPFQRFDRDFISPKARFESRSSRIFFVSSGSFGFVSLQLLAERSVKRLAASGASQESMDFFLSSFWSLLICDEVMASCRLRIIALFRSLSSPEDDRLLRRLVLLRPPPFRFLWRLARFLGLLPDLLLLVELSELSELDSSELELSELELGGDLLVLTLFFGDESLESSRRIDLVLWLLEGDFCLDLDPDPLELDRDLSCDFSDLYPRTFLTRRPCRRSPGSSCGWMMKGLGSDLS
jgi:hypothetical protein